VDAVPSDSEKAAGAFNTWAAFNINTGERNHDASKIGGGFGGSALRGKR
jgi:hypothetical protein